MPVVKVILGSTRPSRFGVQPAEWLMQLTKDHPETTFELIDLKEVNLPFLDEAHAADSGIYEKEHTKAWSKIIDEADGFIVVAGEYNHVAMPALLNAIDYLAAEWQHKPIAYISYGAAAGGARAVEQLRGMAGHLNMYDISDTIVMVNYWTQVDSDGRFIATESQVAAAHRLLETTGFWADAMKDIRAKLKLARAKAPTP